METKISLTKADRGFSLLELLIAMTLTIVIMGLASTLLARSLNIRVKANANADALADAQRALNIMSREIANAGFNLTDNGIVAGDSITDANGNSTLSSPCFNPTIKKQVDSRYINAPAASPGFSNCVNPWRSLADPILRKTAPNEPMNEPTVTSAIDESGVVTSGYTGRARSRPA